MFQVQCYDGTDEIGCENLNKTTPHAAIGGFRAVEESIGPNNILVSWWVTDPSNFELDHLEYRGFWSIAGTNHWLQTQWTKIKPTEYTFNFTKLKPYTEYNFTMGIKERGVEYNSSVFTTAKTAMDTPSAPLGVKAIQDAKTEVVHLEWSAPTYPNGPIKTYLITTEPHVRQWNTGGDATR